MLGVLWYVDLGMRVCWTCPATYMATTGGVAAGRAGTGGGARGDEAQTGIDVLVGTWLSGQAALGAGGLTS